MRVLVFLLSILPFVSMAQEQPRVILVLDASGSMWGQIDGEAKISIAQGVVGDLLGTLPADQELGLTVYGHRRKGDCGDIENLVAPGLDTRDDILAAVQGIKPKGKTPLSAAVVAAAEELRYTEEKATVILVSDGRETCDFDPCAIGSQLEETGVDFTAHVIGFDVGAAEDRAELQCLAENTGGVFRTAKNAAELADALVAVSKPIAPQPIETTFRALDGAGGSVITTPLIWSLAGGEVSVDAKSAPGFAMALLPGTYRVEALRPEDETYVETEVAVGKGNTLVTLVFPELPPPPVEVTAMARVEGTTEVIKRDISWQYFEADGVTAVSEAVIGTEVSHVLARGEYVVRAKRLIDGASSELRFGVGRSAKVVFVELPAYRPAATLEAEASAPVGGQLAVRWTGPDAEQDYISIAKPGARGGQYQTYTSVSDGPFLMIDMPADPGMYELRYILRNDNRILASIPIEATPVEAVLDAPAQAPAGSLIDVSWSGPNYKSDYVTVVLKGAKERTWINYTYTNKGTPLKLQMPVEPGLYELRYVMDRGDRTLGRRDIEVTSLESSLTAPDTAFVGETVTVEWTGGGYKNDYIAFARPGDREGSYLTYGYVHTGKPAEVVAPLEPGTYELRYVLNQGNKTAVARTIEILATEVSLNAPSTAAAGETVDVEWIGPDYKNDYISVAPVGSDETSYNNYTYTRQGSPAKVEMPVQPGEYELRYMANGSRDKAMARQVISVSPVSAEVSAPAQAKAGSEVEVTWTGPNYARDFIGIAEAGGPRYVTYSYTRSGSPLSVRVPDTPGDYVVRYFMGQDDTQLAEVPLKVVP